MQRVGFYSSLGESVLVKFMTPAGAIWSRYQRAVLMRRLSQSLQVVIQWPLKGNILVV